MNGKYRAELIKYYALFSARSEAALAPDTIEYLGVAKVKVVIEDGFHAFHSDMRYTRKNVTDRVAQTIQTVLERSGHNRTAAAVPLWVSPNFMKLYFDEGEGLVFACRTVGSEEVIRQVRAYIGYFESMLRMSDISSAQETGELHFRWGSDNNENQERKI